MITLHFEGKTPLGKVGKSKKFLFVIGATGLVHIH